MALFLKLILVLFTTSVFAADNPLLIGYPPDKIMGFRGLDTKTPDPNVEDGRAVDLLNVKLSQSFDLRKRYGKSTVNATLDDYDLSSPPITGIFNAQYSTGENWVYAFVGSKLKYDSGTTWATVSGSGTITSGANYQWRCTMALDKAICTNNQDAPLSISSTPTRVAASFTGLSNAVTKANAVTWFRNYLIWGNTTENSTVNPTRIRWSNVGTISTYSDEDYIDIASTSGDSITGFVELYGDLFIIMKRSIWKASLVGGDDTYTLTKVIDGFGAIAKESIKLVNLDGNRQAMIYFNENKKLYLFNGVTVTDIGLLAQGTLDGLSSARLQYAVGGADDENYYLSATDGGGSTNDKVIVYNVKINELSVWDDLDFNAFERITNSSNQVKSYIGNYNSFVYWMDDPDKVNDVDGATGIFDSVGYVTTATQTGAVMLIDSGLTSGIYTGATVKITSGTGEDQEAIVLSSTTTGLVLATTLSTLPDTTSSYSIGAIDAYYQTKWYDFGSAPRYKLFRNLYLWGNEATANEVTVSYYEDFGAEVGSQTVSLSPSSSSLWDSALWDVATWGTTGDKLYTTKLTGRAKNISIKFSLNSIDKDFYIYGYHIIGDRLDVQ